MSTSKRNSSSNPQQQYHDDDSFKYRLLKKGSMKSKSSYSGKRKRKKYSSKYYYIEESEQQLLQRAGEDDIYISVVPGEETYFVKRKTSKGKNKSYKSRDARKEYVLQNIFCKSSKKSMKSMKSMMSSKSKSKKGKGKGKGKGCDYYGPENPYTSFQPTSPPTVDDGKRMNPQTVPTQSPPTNAPTRMTARPLPTATIPPNVPREFDCEVDETGIVGDGEGDMTLVEFFYQVETISTISSEQVDRDLLPDIERTILQSMIPDVFPQYCGTNTARNRRKRQIQWRRIQETDGIILGLSSRGPDFVVNGYSCAGNYDDPCYLISGVMTVYATIGMAEDVVIEIIDEAIFKTLRRGVIRGISEVLRVTMLNEDFTPRIGEPTPAPSPRPPTMIPLSSRPTLQVGVPTTLPPTASPVLQEEDDGDGDDESDGGDTVDIIDEIVTRSAIVPIWGWVLVGIGACLLCTCFFLCCKKGCDTVSSKPLNDDDDYAGGGGRGGRDEDDNHEDETSNPFLAPIGIFNTNTNTNRTNNNNDDNDNVNDGDGDDYNPPSMQAETPQTGFNIHDSDPNINTNADLEDEEYDEEYDDNGYGDNNYDDENYDEEYDDNDYDDGFQQSRSTMVGANMSFDDDFR